MRIVSEILDPRTKALAESTDPSDFILSNEIASMLLAQVAVRREMNPIYRELVSAGGADLKVVSRAGYSHTGEEPSFHTLQARARARGAVALGIHRAAQGAVELNPADKTRPLRLESGDGIVVVTR